MSLFKDTLDKMFELLSVHSHEYGMEKKPYEPYEKYKFMQERNVGFMWSSKADFSHTVLIQGDSLELRLGNDSSWLAIDDSVFELEEYECDMPWEINYNIMYLDGGCSAMCIQRHAGTKFLIITSDVDLDSGLEILKVCPTFDIDTVTEEEWFQFSTVEDIPSYDKIVEFRKDFHTAMDACKKHRREITVTLDVNYKIHLEPGDFE